MKKIFEQHSKYERIVYTYVRAFARKKYLRKLRKNWNC